MAPLLPNISANGSGRQFSSISRRTTKDDRVELWVKQLSSGGQSDFGASLPTDFWKKIFKTDCLYNGYEYCNYINSEFGSYLLSLRVSVLSRARAPMISSNGGCHSALPIIQAKRNFQSKKNYHCVVYGNRMYWEYGPFQFVVHRDDQASLFLVCQRRLSLLLWNKTKPLWQIAA